MKSVYLLYENKYNGDKFNLLLFEIEILVVKILK